MLASAPRSNLMAYRSETVKSQLSNRGGLGDASQRPQQRLRILRLRRPANGSYGFHLKGGRENGTGFFISHVEPGTEAFAQGLRTGDQVVRVNERDVMGALHKDVAALVRSGNGVLLHVKSAGHTSGMGKSMEKCQWGSVNAARKMSGYDSRQTTGTRKSPCAPNALRGRPVKEQKCPVKVLIRGAAKSVLGCSICKGPPEKPGIYVQRVTEGGVAHKSGLRAGDRILNCNGTSFVHNDDFQRAVQAMKGCPSLHLEVLPGAGLELVAGESSGYNSSASSETGDDSCPFEADSFSRNMTSSLARSQTSVKKIPLDLSRDWKEIEAEWQDAEIAEKRQGAPKYLSRLSKQISKPSLSRSYLNINQASNANESGSSEIYATCSSCAQLVPMESCSLEPKPVKNLTKHRSMLDLRPTHSEGEFGPGGARIIAENHISKIIIPAAPRNEQSALRRLERLSSAPMQGCSTLPHHIKTGSLTSTSSEETNFRDSYFDPSENHVTENESFSRNRRGHPDPHRLSSEDSDSLLSYPSSTISITDSGGGKFTSTVHIRSSPPAPPPRGNSTKLSRHYRKHKCGQSRKIYHQEDKADASGSHYYLSQDSFSGSSDDSIPWNEDLRSRVTVTVDDNYAPIIPPPPPLSQQDHAPPIPPPPPPMPPSTFPKPTLTSEGFAALSPSDRLQEITGAAARLKTTENRPVHKKQSVIDPNKLQHEKLMEEFKKAHALLVKKRELKKEAEES